jgi:photosystem II stability/assembly factor-like uncharacterized protein
MQRMTKLVTPLALAIVLAGCARSTTSAHSGTASTLATRQRRAPLALQTTGASVRDMTLLTATQGWVLTDRALEITADGGLQWTDISPQPSLGPDQPTNAIKAVFFLDSLQGWEVSQGTSATTYVYRTTDGGHTWSSVSFTVPASSYGGFGVATSLSFVDPLNGWLAVDLGTNANFTSGTLYQTTDGGITWDQESIPVGDASLQFITTSGGWAIGGPGGGQLYRTVDGGETWTSVSLAAPPPYISEVTSYSPPWFSDSKNGVLPATFEAEEQTGVGFFTTQDAGATWTLAASVGVTDVASGQFPSQAISSTQWADVLTDNLQMMWTSDAGQTWVTLSPPAFPSGVVKISFVSGVVGWAIATASGCSGYKTGCTDQGLLVSTRDGGATWAQLNP